MKNKLLPVRVFSKIAIRRAFRDKTAIFFIFLFPLIFLLIFGNIFGGNNNVSFRIALINKSNNDFSKEFVNKLKESKTFNIDETITNFDQAQEKMNRGQIDATLELPEDFGAVKNNKYPSGQAKVVYTQNGAEASATFITVLQGVFQDINKQFVQTDQPFIVKSEQLNSKGLSQFDYVFAGLLGFSIIGLGIFGPVNVFPELKKQGVLRRLHTTPLRVWQYFLANVVSQSVVGLLSIFVMFVVAIIVFNLNVTGNIIELAIFCVLSISMILGIGLSIGGWAKNERQSAPLANLIVFPMLFLSGTFFPRFLMPEWLQNISNFLPLTPVIDGIRLIATEGKSLVELGPQLGLILGWTVIIYLIAFRVFRWE